MDRKEIESRVKIMMNSAARGLLTSDELEDLWFKRMILEMAGPDMDVPAIEPKAEKIGKKQTGWAAEIDNTYWNTQTLDQAPTAALVVSAIQQLPQTNLNIPRQLPNRRTEIMAYDIFMDNMRAGAFEGRGLTVLSHWNSTETNEDTVEIEYNE